MRGLFSSVPVEYGTVSGSFPNAGGNVSFTFIPSVNVVRSTRDGGFRITPEPVTCSLSPEGNLVGECDNTSVKLLACGVGFVPQEWFWTVTSNLPGWRPFSFVLSSGENVVLQPPAPENTSGNPSPHQGNGDYAEHETRVAHLNKITNILLDHSYWKENLHLPASKADDNKGEVEGLIIGSYMIPLKNYSFPWFEFGVSRVEIDGQVMELPENTSVGGLISPETDDDAYLFGAYDSEFTVNITSGVKNNMHLTNISETGIRHGVSTNKAIRVPATWPQGAIAKFTPKIYEPGKQFKRVGMFLNSVITDATSTSEHTDGYNTIREYRVTATLNLPPEVDDRFALGFLKVYDYMNMEITEASGRVRGNPAYSDSWCLESITQAGDREYTVTFSATTSLDLADAKYLTLLINVVVDENIHKRSSRGMQVRGTLHSPAMRDDYNPAPRVFVSDDYDGNVLINATRNGDPLVILYGDEKYEVSYYNTGSRGVAFTFDFGSTDLAERIPGGAEVILMRADDATGIPNAG